MASLDEALEPEPPRAAGATSVRARAAPHARNAATRAAQSWSRPPPPAPAMTHHGEPGCPSGAGSPCNGDRHGRRTAFSPPHGRQTRGSPSGPGGGGAHRTAGVVARFGCAEGVPRHQPLDGPSPGAGEHATDQRRKRSIDRPAHRAADQPAIGIASATATQCHPGNTRHRACSSSPIVTSISPLRKGVARSRWEERKELEGRRVCRQGYRYPTGCQVG